MILCIYSMNSLFDLHLLLVAQINYVHSIDVNIATATNTFIKTDHLLHVKSKLAKEIITWFVPLVARLFWKWLIITVDVLISTIDYVYLSDIY